MNSPQKKGTCLKVYYLAPKKPCSAKRPVGRVTLTTKITVFCHFPGEEHPKTLKKYSVVLVRGGRPNDLPAVKYRAIRNAKRTDFRPLYSRISSKSIYGMKNTVKIKKVRLARRKEFRQKLMIGL